jgi:hypothetical protein
MGRVCHAVLRLYSGVRFSWQCLAQLVEEKLTGMINRQSFPDELIDNINLKTEEQIGPLLEEKRVVDRKLREVHDQIDTSIDVRGCQDNCVTFFHTGTRSPNRITN